MSDRWANLPDDVRAEFEARAAERAARRGEHAGWRLRYALANGAVWGVVYGVIGMVAFVLTNGAWWLIGVYAMGGFVAGFACSRTRGRGGTVIFALCYLGPLFVNSGLQFSVGWAVAALFGSAATASLGGMSGVMIGLEHSDRES